LKTANSKDKSENVFKATMEQETLSSKDFVQDLVHNPMMATLAETPC